MMISTEDWKRMSPEERFRVRKLEFKDEIERRKDMSRSRWSRLEASTRTILADSYVEDVIGGTVDHNILLGSILKNALENILRHIQAKEHEAREIPGGLPFTNRRKH